MSLTGVEGTTMMSGKFSITVHSCCIYITLHTNVSSVEHHIKQVSLLSRNQAVMSLTTVEEYNYHVW